MIPPDFCDTFDTWKLDILHAPQFLRRSVHLGVKLHVNSCSHECQHHPKENSNIGNSWSGIQLGTNFKWAGLDLNFLPFPSIPADI